MMCQLVKLGKLNPNLTYFDKLKSQLCKIEAVKSRSLHGLDLWGTNAVGKWESLLTCLRTGSKNNFKVKWFWNKKFLLLISLISRLFCSKGWSNYLVNWSDLFQKMVKLTLRLESLESLEQVAKGQIYQPYLSTYVFV